MNLAALWTCRDNYQLIPILRFWKYNLLSPQYDKGNNLLIHLCWFQHSPSTSVWSSLVTLAQEFTLFLSAIHLTSPFFCLTAIHWPLSLMKFLLISGTLQYATPLVTQTSTSSSSSFYLTRSLASSSVLLSYVSWTSFVVFLFSSFSTLCPNISTIPWNCTTRGVPLIYSFLVPHNENLNLQLNLLSFFFFLLLYFRSIL